LGVYSGEILSARFGHLTAMASDMSMPSTYAVRHVDVFGFHRHVVRICRCRRHVAQRGSFMPFSPELPHNGLPPLPPAAELETLADLGILEERKAGREKVFVNPAFLRVLAAPLT
jgi:hypothetical protein